jgi:hypothetical protein
MTDPAAPPVDPAARLVDADRQAALARQRLSNTLTALQTRLTPSKLIREASVVGDVAGRVVTGTARQNPGVVAGSIAALALLFVRKPILRFFRRRPATEPVPASSAISEEQP